MEIARHWRLKAQRYRLEGSLCPICGRPSFPPRPACSDCAAQPALIEVYELEAPPPAERFLEIVASERMIG